jgi:hypothetical protein
MNANEPPRRHVDARFCPLILMTFSSAPPRPSPFRDAWSSVGRMVRNGFSGLVAAAAGAFALIISTHARADESGTLVQFTADDPNATLEMHAEGESESRQWKSLCVAPCEERVPAGTALRVKGESIYPSAAFYLPSGRDSVTLHANTATKSGRTMAAVAAVGGGIVFANGAGLLLFGLAVKSIPELRDSSGGYVAVGLVGMTLGATVGIIGLVNLLGNETTTDVSNAGESPRFAVGHGLQLSSAGLHF